MEDLLFLAIVAIKEKVLAPNVMGGLLGEELSFAVVGHYVCSPVVPSPEPTGYKYPGRKIKFKRKPLGSKEASRHLPTFVLLICDENAFFFLFPPECKQTNGKEEASEVRGARAEQRGTMRKVRMGRAEGTRAGAARFIGSFFTDTFLALMFKVNENVPYFGVWLVSVFAAG